MPNRRQFSLRNMLAALDGDQRKRLEAATAGVVAPQAHRPLTRYVAWRLLTESRRAELRIAHKLEAARHG